MSYLRHRATINGKTYDTAEAESITDYPSADGDDFLYRSAEAGFFLVNTATFLDGRRLQPWQEVDELAPELSFGNLEQGSDAIRAERRRRIRIEHEIVPLTDREAMVWCIKAHIPECFRGYLLESI